MCLIFEPAIFFTFQPTYLFFQLIYFKVSNKLTYLNKHTSLNYFKKTITVPTQNTITTRKFKSLYLFAHFFSKNCYHRNILFKVYSTYSNIVEKRSPYSKQQNEHYFLVNSKSQLFLNSSKSNERSYSNQDVHSGKKLPNKQPQLYVYQKLQSETYLKVNFEHNFKLILLIIGKFFCHLFVQNPQKSDTQFWQTYLPTHVLFCPTYQKMERHMWIAPKLLKA